MLRDRLQAFLKNNKGKWIQADIARAIGKSEGAISSYLRGKYGAKDLSSIESDIEAFLNKQEMREQLPRPLEVGFVPTTVSAQMFGVADYCRVRRNLGVATGKSGIGKTTAAIEYAKRHSDTVLVYCNATTTLSSLLREIAREIGASDRGTNNIVFQEIENRIGDRLIIIDEAEHLKYSTLDALRSLVDKHPDKNGKIKGGAAILLIGLPSFMEYIRSRPKDFKYFRGRIDHNDQINNPDKSDFAKIISKAFPNHVSDQVCKWFFDASNGDLRTLSKMMNKTYELAVSNNINTIDKVLIESAAKYIERY